MKKQIIAISLSLILMISFSCSKKESPEPKEKAPATVAKKESGWAGKQVPDRPGNVASQ